MFCNFAIFLFNRILLAEYYIYSSLNLCNGRGGLVVRSRLRARRIPGSKPDSMKINRAWGPSHAKPYLVTKCPPAGVVQSLEKGCQLRCSRRHLTVVQNYEVGPEIALLLLQNGTLI
ncbi:hypothetical protein AVEN_42876-1 [Araneus ventricosus]|uniref:Uncharacterized protein n=1 Tax=Araneus ventricosus TaxID=182803 RepID=A0A4Y2AF49_ARAVE|nr:hypothetical protein AVEN_42876-1 [Araneus ventricosus]